MLRNIRVIAIDQRLESKAGEAVPAHTATFEVTPKQSEVIVLASEIGKVSLSLRSLVPDPSEAPAAAQTDATPKVDEAAAQSTPGSSVAATATQALPRFVGCRDGNLHPRQRNQPAAAQSASGKDASGTPTVSILRGSVKQRSCWPEQVVRDNRRTPKPGGMMMRKFLALVAAATAGLAAERRRTMPPDRLRRPPLPLPPCGYRAARRLTAPATRRSAPPVRSARFGRRAADGARSRQGLAHPSAAAGEHGVHRQPGRRRCADQIAHDDLPHRQGPQARPRFMPSTPRITFC